jgi:hypothetical protein
MMGTRKKLNIKVIIAKNPKVDAERLEQGLEAIKELLKTGVKPSSYSLETPESGKTMHRIEAQRPPRKAISSQRSAP